MAVLYTITQGSISLFNSCKQVHALGFQNTPGAQVGHMR